MKLIESLREKAGKAHQASGEFPWQQDGNSVMLNGARLHNHVCTTKEIDDEQLAYFARFIAACSPEVILALCDAAEALEPMTLLMSHSVYGGDSRLYIPACKALAKLGALERS